MCCVKVHISVVVNPAGINCYSLPVIRRVSPVAQVAVAYTSAANDFGFTILTTLMSICSYGFIRIKMGNTSRT